jgi:hypothetical protein
MRVAWIVALFLLVCLASTSRAGGVNLTWSTSCWTNDPVVLKSFACNTNASKSWAMTASFMPDADVTDFVGIEMWLEGLSYLTTLPDWWKVGSCGARTASFHADKSGAADEVCVDWASAGVCEEFTYTWDTNRAHVYAAAVLDTNHPAELLAGVEYYAGTVQIQNGATVGTGSCGGCSTGMKWGLAEIDVLQRDGTRTRLTYPLGGGNQCIDWQSTGAFVGCTPICVVPFCVAPSRNSLATLTAPCQPVRARASTWGSIKSLYR